MKYVIPKNTPIKGRRRIPRPVEEWTDYTTTKEHIFGHLDVISKSPDMYVFSLPTTVEIWQLMVECVKVIRVTK